MHYLQLLFVLLPCALALPAENATEKWSGWHQLSPFEMVDSDNDTKITWTEFENWQKRQGNSNDDEIEQMFGHFDADNNSALNIREFVQLVYRLSRKNALQAAQLFKAIDKNRDGVMTREEALNSETHIPAKIVETMFNIADDNKDGRVSLDEFERAANSEEKAKTQEEQDKESAEHLLNQIDQNNDKKINVQEVHAFASQFGTVSESDVLRAFNFLDSNADGWLDAAELQRLPEKMNALTGMRPPPPV